MPRELTGHKVNGCNDGLKIEVQDDPGHGGACHRYTITGPENRLPEVGMVPAFQVKIRFQNGPIKEVGTNGITHEALLAILADRLEGFQSGPYACEDNAEALAHIKAAQEVLQRRTKARLARGVEGTHTV